MFEHTKKFIISVFGCERRRKKGYNSQEHHQTKHHEDEVKLRKRAKCCTLLHTYNDDKDTVYRPFILVCHHTTIKQSTSSSSPSRSHTRLPTKHQEQYHHRSYGSECSFSPFRLAWITWKKSCTMDDDGEGFGFATTLVLGGGWWCQAWVLFCFTSWYALVWSPSPIPYFLAWLPWPAFLVGLTYLVVPFQFQQPIHNGVESVECRAGSCIRNGISFHITTWYCHASKSCYFVERQDRISLY